MDPPGSRDMDEQTQMVMLAADPDMNMNASNFSLSICFR